MPRSRPAGTREEGIGMRKLFMATVTVAMFGRLVSPALAAKGGNGMTRAAADRRRTRTRESRSRTTANSGSAARSASRPTPWDSPAGSTRCTPSGATRTSTATGSTSSRRTAETFVCAEMRTPNEELLLGGGGSEWLWSGGDAKCWAVLYACGWRAASSRRASPRPSASTRRAERPWRIALGAATARVMRPPTSRRWRYRNPSRHRLIKPP